jgi:hypothetical protein
LGSALLGAGNGLAAGLLFQRPGQPAGAGRRAERLQAHDPSGVLGFNWGIDPASPEQIRTAQIGLLHRPALVDHDALADSLVDRHTIYHFYLKSAWIVLEMPE